MEFWGVEVKAGEPLKVNPVPGMVIHLSQACLGETKGKATEPILLHVKVGEQKLVLGLLSLDKFPQLTFDLVFEQSFELSHNWKSGSIHFCGYQTDLDNQGEGEEFDLDEDESEEEEEEAVPVAIPNGKSDKKVEKANQAVVKSNAAAAAKPESSGKPKAPVVAPKKAGKDEDSDGSDDDSDDAGGSSDDDSDEDMLDGDDSDDDEDASDDDSDEETPKKPESGKKRPNESASKTPVPAKKGKVDTPSKSEGKKVNVHIATPHPAKKGAKTPGTAATAEKSKSQTPKSGGVVCKSCSKTFGTDKALDSHTKAKHV